MMFRLFLVLLLVLGVGLACYGLAVAPPTGDSSPQARREAAMQAFTAGNFKDAYEAYAALALDPNTDPTAAADDLNKAVQCLNRLGRPDEIDEFREKVIAAHADHWRVLWEAAKSYHAGDGYGTIVAGKFYRGGRRGGDGKHVYSGERDRVRALQLMHAAMQKVGDEPKKDDVSELYFSLADMLTDNRHGSGAWRLQYLSDLSILPDYEEGGRYNYGGQARGAPVDENGDPIFHRLPTGWEQAKTDGERWRWCLMQGAELEPSQRARAQFAFARFLQTQFDVQTMARGGYAALFGRGHGGGDDEAESKEDTGPFAVSTLAEDETIARLATGVKRFKLPDEFNFIKIYKDILAANEGYTEHAHDYLALLFEDRQQYPRAAEYWRIGIQQRGDENMRRNARLRQIVGNWGQFDPMAPAPAGREATAGFVFRNGAKVSFEAHEINVQKLLADVKAYLKTRPNQLDWETLDVGNVGHRLVEKNQEQYRGKQVAAWEMDLQPRGKHLDKRVTIKTPLSKPGAYLVTARMHDGNVTRIVLWVADTVIVKKPLDGGSYYFVADAATGSPVPKANLSFFGYQHKHVRDNQFELNLHEFAEFGDADGQLRLKGDLQRNGFAYLITATTEGGRFAYHGFTGIWSGRYADYEQHYNQRKVFAITDRPVYRPGQSVKFKFWVGQAKYDAGAGRDEQSPYANQTFTVAVHNPKGDKIFERPFQADAYGGFDGELPLEKDATLGVYGLHVLNMGGGSFRVEEYKKPEFEVKIDAPAEPVMLGEKITATINAKYYFGAPVTEAKVKYKVVRSSREASWYPAGRWDWFYDPGYWWFAYDYHWYPGWSEWGTTRPRGWWWGSNPQPPEVVIENDVPIGPDGTVKVEIDTALAKAVHADTDHKYEITAEVTDASRRTIVGQGSVSVARKPFKVYAWVHRGYYTSGEVVAAEFSAQTLDHKPIAKGKGVLKLLKVTYDAEQRPVENEVQTWDLDTDDEGRAAQQIKAAQPGQYRLSYTVTDAKGRAIEGGYVFVVRGQGFDGKEFRFNDVEVIADKKEYGPGENVRLMINTSRPDSTVVLFVRPANGIYLPPKVVRLRGKSAVEEIEVVKKDMPNFFVEAMTIGDGKVFSETKEIVVPPENRVVNIEVLPSSKTYKPGQKAKVQLKLTDATGEPIIGSAVVSLYDKSVEYVSGGSNVPEIKAFFWKWRRRHYPQSESNLNRYSAALAKSGEVTMAHLGQFGHMVADLAMDRDGAGRAEAKGEGGAIGGGPGGGFGEVMRRSATPSKAAQMAPAAPGAAAGNDGTADRFEQEGQAAAGPAADPGGGTLAPDVEPAVRKNFADTALWVANLTTNQNGLAEVELEMPENLTTWKAKVWSMGAGTRVGQGEAEIVTSKDLLVRLQAPRFFVQKDEIVLSANVHNYLKSGKTVKVSMEIDELDGAWVTPLDAKIERVAGAGGWGLGTSVEVAPGGEQRVDWRVRVDQPGRVTVRMKAVTDEESDAMEMTFPVYVHGMLKTESYAGALRPGEKAASLTISVPRERLPEQSRLEIRYSPSLAAAMVDALPYLVDFPYGCTEQTLNRFVPTVVTQRTLLSMGLDLKDIQQKRTNLNAQEIGDDAERARDWKRNNRPNPGVPERNPVFDEAVLAEMVKEGITKLTNMQLSDGGWGWFSGWGERSDAHTTAVVVHGLQIARDNDVALPAGVLERGVEWLRQHQARQVQLIRNAPTRTDPWKQRADDLDAFVHMVLVDQNVLDPEMLEFLFRDRVELAVYSKAVYGLALFKLNQKEKLNAVLKNISQFLVEDGENQTAYLKLPENNYWWYWYGTDTEANGFYLKLLSRTDPEGETAPKLAKYLVNNRKHATYWNSTRDTAICIEALAEYIKASGEDKPDMKLAIHLDGRKVKDVTINAANFFSFDNKLILLGQNVPAGEHKIDFVKEGSGPLYYNAYVTNFTLEDPIKKAGLEIKVQRKFYKLVPADKKMKVSGARGQAVDQKVETYDRQPLDEAAVLTSGDLVEVELEIDSKNDYEYMVFEDMKASGFEPVDVRSGYNGNDLNAYMELRDERVCFFARTLARGKHSVAYRLRAEIPGKFSALPTKATAMYAPELRANSDENKLNIEDAPALKPRPRPEPAASAK